ncbi:MAG: hypothetical protein IRZ05_16585 [Micromonosporaceae bacterium]|nr:hypothetical protein [Micromonosporaceae bacterium]
MPVSRALLLISTVAGVISVAGALSSDERQSTQGGLAMLVALVGYVIVAGRAAPPRTRWSLADRTWLVAAGTLLLGVAAAIILSDLSDAWSGWWTFAQPGVNIAAPLLAVEVRVGAPAVSSPEVSEAVRTAAELAGPAVLAVGALRAARTA